MFYQHKQSGAQLHLQGGGGNGRVGIFTVSITGITGRMGPQTPLKMITMSWMRPLGGYCAIRINISLSSHIISQHITYHTINISLSSHRYTIKLQTIDDIVQCGCNYGNQFCIQTMEILFANVFITCKRQEKLTNYQI